MRWLHLLFFIAGFPALLYQIVWQRALFTIYGVNIESVTVVVAAFMLGLGVGSLVGGAVSKGSAVAPIAAFAAIEVTIGCFGVGSLRLFDRIGDLTLGASALNTFLISIASTH